MSTILDCCSQSMSAELSKCLAIGLGAVLMGANVLPRSLLAPLVAVGAVQLFSLQTAMRLPKGKQIEAPSAWQMVHSCRDAAAQCPRGVLALPLVAAYLALGFTSASDYFFLHYAVKAGLAFALGGLWAFAPEDKEEVPEFHWEDDACPYSADFWEFSQPEEPEVDPKDLIDVLFLRK
eukprot:CAMPEP_0181456708 /NCGR_PEP_ID=MMETSP1110-20121109/31410_1 /TAXON_ID=174948 /ORGANISM="Symbiodinium sp., Strain CCMP421" /LENGTH=177 /DNA_ID=CAMNT_0023581127 /DNA_START=6 /DNA_END=536 /DNA_ORIENTATION=-